MDTEQIKRYIQFLEAGKKPWLGVWDKVYRFVLPERAYLFGAHGDAPSYEKLYDATAVNAAERLTNLIISGLCPPWQRWARFSPGHQVVRETDRTQLRKITEQVEKKIFTLLNQSNFYQEFQPFILDRVVGGTASLGLDTSDRLSFQSIPLSEVAFADDAQGNIVAISRTFTLPFFLLERLYPECKKITEWYSSAKDNPQQQHKLVLFSYRTVVPDWETTVHLEANYHVLKKETTTFPPILGSRWAKVPGSPYGRGPAIRSLSDIRAANRLKELVLKNAARTSLGIYTVVDDGVINPYTLTLQEGSFIPVASNDRAAPSIAGLPPAGDFDVSMISLERLQSEIKNSFIADQFGPVDKTPMSATEVAERTRVVAQELGMTIGRLEFEVLIPLMKICLEYLKKTDPDIPTELTLDGKLIEVEFTSRLAMSQWAMEDQELSHYLAEVAQYAQVEPRAAFMVDVVEALRYKAELKGIPAKLLMDDKYINQRMEQMQEMQAAEEGANVGR